MAISYVVARFSKPGKGFPQVPQLDNDGKPILDSDGKPVIGNEQYTCNQLTDETIIPAHKDEQGNDVPEKRVPASRRRQRSATISSPDASSMVAGAAVYLRI